MPSTSERSRPGKTPARPGARPFDDPTTLRLLVERIQEGVYITDTEGRFLDANPAFLDILGVEGLEALSAHRATEFMVDPAARQRQLEILRRDGEVREFELDVLRTDGTHRAVHDTCFLVEPTGEGEGPQPAEPLIYGMVVDITRRKELEQRLRERSRRDTLTGCYNRRYLFELARSLTEEEYSGPWGVLVFDLDHFKRFNDELGHMEGDRVLVRMARFLMGRSRGDDPVVRMGGDEFLLFLRGADLEETRRVAERFGVAAEIDAPAAYTLGWAVRASDESLYDTAERADQELIRARVRVRSGSRRVEEP